MQKNHHLFAPVRLLISCNLLNVIYFRSGRQYQTNFKYRVALWSKI